MSADTITAEEMRIMRHTIGLGTKDQTRKPYRNRFFVNDPREKNFATCRALVAAGLMYCETKGFFALTETGYAAAIASVDATGFPAWRDL